MAGSYRLIAANNSGSVTSAVVTLTVYDATMPPQIIHQPDSLKGTNGGRAVFGVTVSSATPCTYQWLFNDVPISGATNVTLLLTSLTVAQMGNYSVTVSNAVGGVTSAAAVLDLPLTPVLTVRQVGRGLRVTISSLFATGQVQFSTNLLDWQTLTNLPPSATGISYVDPVTNAPCRVYRVVIPR